MKESLSEKQKTELCDAVGKFLVGEIETESIRNKVKKLVTDYAKKNKLDADPSELFNAMDWSVKVLLKNRLLATHFLTEKHEIARTIMELGHL